VKKLNNRLENKFKQLREHNEKALAAFLMGGDPEFNVSLALCEAAIEGGADILEIGVPFSDPLADGPVNQKAARRALDKGINVNHILDMAEHLRGKYKNMPIVLLLYFNTIFQFGVPAFKEKAISKGVDGLIIPDLPLEEKELLAKEEDISEPIFVDLLATTTEEKRMENLAKKARGFIYCVSQAGVTGMRENISPEIFSTLQRLRKFTSTPLLVGFGISHPEQARHISKEADGVIIGSVLVKEIENNEQNFERLPLLVRSKVKEFKEAIS